MCVDICLERVIAYCIPASPPEPATPVDQWGIEARWVAQEVEVGEYVAHQVDSLHSCLRQEQNCEALELWIPAWTK